ncbi:tryptophan halogenase family protein [Asticcacaulis sp. 201]|uniref:tryptophan halogenase family protein n=1 Tax=Asticcacaulis sp. 201 TaxID=3028787 RepID=UPI002915C709|nr:tryptophan halogenase family protein [Asticcacaulis sp. 201]MDV6330910.1 tryptophan halogenase family protein [Asticcacaulis sp. 201]
MTTPKSGCGTAFFALNGIEMATTGPLRTIVIVGGGTAGWMVANALSKVLGKSGPAITLIESEEIGTVGVGEATIPPILAFNALLGINEVEFMRETQATFKLGIEFADWLRIGHRYFHPFGIYGVDAGAVPFEALWQRSRHLGASRPLNDFSVCARAAAAGCFMRPAGAGGPLAHLAYAYHFDATLYARYLRKRAEAAGVIRIEGRIAHTSQRPDDGFIEAVRTQDGRRIEADFFIDCSGFNALLLGGVMGVKFEDWNHWLPNDRAVAAPSTNLAPPTPFTTSTARTAGWQWRIPLQHRTGNGYVYSSHHASDQQALDLLTANVTGDLLAEPRVIKFRTGRQREFWIKNCLALGLASGFMEPLESTSIHLVQAGIARLLEMFPNRSCEPADVRRYNRLMTNEYESIRDFIILHFHATERRDTDYWRSLADMSIPDTLAERIDIYRHSGRVFRESDDLFSKTSWLAVMDGQGLVPQAYDPLAEGVLPTQAQKHMEHIASVQAAAVAAMPSHNDYIAKYCAANPPGF